ncbi:MAG TPA: hypothetical protein VLA19_24320 [Herpetosiphonaceae bacterium]|nr:hypothetical protein [Herpetosiphonaceae bacterium]
MTQDDQHDRSGQEPPPLQEGQPRRKDQYPDRDKPDPRLQGHEERGIRPEEREIRPRRERRPSNR